MSFDDVVFEDPIEIRLTPYQRTFLARRTLKALEHSLDYRDHIEEKYGDQANPVCINGRITSLRGLAIKLGVEVEEIPS